MEEFLFRLQPDLRVLGELRRELARWLTQIGVGDAALTDIVLATHEAAANAIEHSEEAFGPGQVDAWLLDGVLTVEISDNGTWAAPRPTDDERGRGLTLIENLGGEVRVDTNSRGTTIRLVYRGAQARASSREET